MSHPISRLKCCVRVRWICRPRPNASNRFVDGMPSAWNPVAHLTSLNCSDLERGWRLLSSKTILNLSRNNCSDGSGFSPLGGFLLFVGMFWLALVVKLTTPRRRFCSCWNKLVPAMSMWRGLCVRSGMRERPAISQVKTSGGRLGSNKTADSVGSCKVDRVSCDPNY